MDNTIQKFLIGERVKIWKSGRIQFEIINSISMYYDGEIYYNGYKMGQIEKCTQYELDTYFKV